LHALRGARVLVVSPFGEDVERQYHRGLDKVWNATMPAAFASLVSVEAPISLESGEGTMSWSESLATLEKRIAVQAHRFDVALLACGGYGLPASDFIYTTLNKTAIYVGGVLQTYFGIRGSRWERADDQEKAYAGALLSAPRAWICPGHRPTSSEVADHGSYWCK